MLEAEEARPDLHTVCPACATLADDMARNTMFLTTDLDQGTGFLFSCDWTLFLSRKARKARTTCLIVLGICLIRAYAQGLP